MVQGYDWLCDKCGKFIYDEQCSRTVLNKLISAGKVIVERSKDGILLHYCNKFCCAKHRGPQAGQNRLIG